MAKKVNLEDCLVKQSFSLHQSKSCLEDLDRECRTLPLGSPLENIDGVQVWPGGRPAEIGELVCAFVFQE